MICDNVSNIIKKEFDSEPVYNDKCFTKITKIKAKTKHYEGEINTNFHNDKKPKEGSQCICLSVVLIDCFSSGEKLLSSSVFGIMYIHC